MFIGVILFVGITQEDIDEQRRVPEREMLSAMESYIKNGVDLNKIDAEQGAAPVSIQFKLGFFAIILDSLICCTDF